MLGFANNKGNRTCLGWTSLYALLHGAIYLVVVSSSYMLFASNIGPAILFSDHRAIDICSCKDLVKLLKTKIGARGEVL
jgi:hypothetical protein